MTTEKLYPTLPSAPPESDGDQINSNLMRRDRINQIYNELKQYRDQRYKTYKKYSKAASILSNSTVVLNSLAVIESTAGVATSLTLVGTPVGIVLTGLGALAGLTAAILTPITKHCDKKKSKHSKMYYILDTGISVLSKKVSAAVDNHEITQSEFKYLLEEYEKIKQKLYEFNIDKLREDLKKEIVSRVK